MDKVNFLDDQFFLTLKEKLIENNALSEKEFEIFESIEIMQKLIGEDLNQETVQKTIEELINDD